MLTIHDQVTRQMCDRLETTCIGLGLVRLLQDAKRFEEARTVLYALEGGTQSAKANHKPGKRISRPASSSSRSARIDAA